MGAHVLRIDLRHYVRFEASDDYQFSDAVVAAEQPEAFQILLCFTST